MTDPSFLLQRAAAKDLVDYARDLQALVDIRTAAMAQPLIGTDIDLAVLEDEAEAYVNH